MTSLKTLQLVGIRQLANMITLTRILGVALIFWLTPYHTNFWQIITVLTYTLICVTDFLDGWIARRLNIVSDLGKILDPLADKILVLVCLPLLEMQVISSFPVFIILAREFAIMALRVVLAKEGEDVEAKLSGKIKTAITLPVCGILFGRVAVEQVPNLPGFLEPLNTLGIWVYSWPSWVFDGLIWAMVIITIWSFFDYFGRYLWQQYVKKMGTEENAKRGVRALIPNTFTLLNLIFGVLAAVFAWFGLFHHAVLLVILGILFDAVDGSLARKLDAFSKWGARLDSKADFVSFGIAPAVIVYKSLSSHGGWGWLAVAVTLATAYYISVQYRLTRFNETGHSGYFEGLPSPIGAILVVLAAISQWLSHPVCFIGIVLGAIFLMVSKIRYAHLEMASRETFLRYLKIPAFIFLILTMLNLLRIRFAQDIFAYEILFGLTFLYVVYPVFASLKKSTQSDA